MQDFTGVPVHRRPRHHARGRGATSAATRPRSTRSRRPSWSSTTRSSPTCSAAPTRSSATSSSSTSATASATSSCAGARPRSTTSRSSRRAPASCTRSTSSTWRASIFDRESTASVAYPDTLRRHRLAHHDGQRPRRPRLGRRRHRGRGGHARPARVDAHPAGRRLQADRRDPGRAPPRPTSCSRSPRCCASTAWSASSSSSTARASAAVPLANRATIGNMSPEFGSTAAIFPIDDVTLDYLRLTGRSEEQVALVEAYAKEQGLWHDPADEPVFTEYLELDLSTVVPSHRRPEAAAGPGRADRRQGSVPRGARATTSTTGPTTTSTRPARSRSPRPTRRPQRAERPQAAARPHPAHAAGRRRPGQPQGGGDAGRRHADRARPRRRGDRLDHLLHQHLQPLGDGGGRPAGQEGRRARARRASRGSRPRWRPAPRSSPTTTTRPA